MGLDVDVVKRNGLTWIGHVLRREEKAGEREKLGKEEHCAGGTGGNALPGAKGNLANRNPNCEP